MQIPKKLINALLSISFLSLSIFFRKIALSLISDRFYLILCFMIFANLTLSLNLILSQKEWLEKIKKISWSEIRLSIFAGSFLFAFYALATLGLDLTTSINYSFISRSTLIFTILLAYFFLGERLNWEKVLLMFTFFIGIYMISTEGKRIIFQFGDLLILSGTFFFSAFAILQKKMCKNLTPDVICWTITFNGTIAAIILSLLLKVNIFPLYRNGLFWVMLAGAAEALAVLYVNKTTIISTVTYYSMMSMLTPILNIFLGIIFLSEPLTVLQIIGGTILIASGILVQKFRV